MIFNNCQYLEKIKIWCGLIFLSEKEVLETTVTYSSKTFHELIFYHTGKENTKLLPEELESLLVCWTDRYTVKTTVFNYPQV